jgi:hypothetical protein
MQLAPHPGHHFRALVADAVASGQEAVARTILPWNFSLGHELPFPWPRTGGHQLTERFVPNRWFGTAFGSSIERTAEQTPQRRNEERLSARDLPAIDQEPGS